MKIHPIQTGSVRVKTAQIEGRGSGLMRQAAIFRDKEWTDWLPTYAWAIEYRDSVIVVDSGQGVQLLEHRSSLHPYIRWEVDFQIESEQELGPQLRSFGIGQKDVKTVVLTHLHIDHDGGLHHLRGSDIFVSPSELAVARGWMGRMRGYLPNRWPSWFEPLPLHLADAPCGPFMKVKKITPDGQILAVGTPGHTIGHVSVVVWVGDTAVFLAGDASYTEDLMLAGKADGVSANETVATNTLRAIREFKASQLTLYLPTHDPCSKERLKLLKKEVRNPREG